MNEEKNIFVFDVESTSLHGTGFAVGAVVLKRDGTILDRFELCSEEGKFTASDWVIENVIPHLQNMPLCANNRDLRDSFYDFYMKHKETCEIWSDCNFPVETNFLSQIVNDNHEERQWNMPYPLKDISKIIDVKIDRAHTSGIKYLRKHHPLDDSIASANLLIKKLRPNGFPDSTDVTDIEFWRKH